MPAPSSSSGLGVTSGGPQGDPGGGDGGGGTSDVESVEAESVEGAISIGSAEMV